MTVTRKSLLTLLAMVLLRGPLSALLSAVLPDASQWPGAFYVASMVQELVLFLLPACLLRGRKTPLRRPGGARLWLIPALLAAAVVLRGASTSVNVHWRSLTGAPAMPLPEVAGAAGWALKILALAVIPAVTEEAFFRGALLTALRRDGGTFAATLITTLTFAFMHGSVAGLPGHLLISLALTLIMLRTDWLIAPITVHMAYNLLALFWPETGLLTTLLFGAAALGLTVGLLQRIPADGTKTTAAADAAISVLIVVIMAAQYLLFFL